ncbi:N-acetyltransferase [uncultured Parolsenella sp.]|uniref:N-acetyltransferase n=1 Tax=uncultured Parolsenella sp. TaxID=2083008 RepID=UPI0025E96D5E|nr:N-acetyltransferase [uncultured Parolsenella sp.]
MQIRTATAADLDDLARIYAAARRFMAENGNPTQWGDGRPTAAEIAETVEAGACLVGVDDAGTPHFAFSLYTEADPTYQQIYNGAWLNDEPYLTIHRVASDGCLHGVFAAIVAFARERAAAADVANVRVDTHEDNKPMQHLIAKAGFAYCGVIHLADGDPRLAYQLIL